MYISVGMTICFAFVNGFHDGANVVATIICSKSMHPIKALAIAASAEFLGALLLGTAVAYTMAGSILTTEMQDHLTAGHIYCLVISAVGGAIIWNIITWFLGLPSSSSHALVGGLIGAGLIAMGPGGVALDKVTKSVFLPMLLAPGIGMAGGFLIFYAIKALFGSAHRSVGNLFTVLQKPSMVFLAASHGSNDAQKAMGMILLVLIAEGSTAESTIVPEWACISCAAALAVGLSVGGWRIVKTVGYGICRLEPVHSFASQMTSTLVILGASLIGWPVSTAQVVASSVMGVGSSSRLSGVRWTAAANIAYAWLLTVPVSAAFSALIFGLLMRITAP